MNWLQPLLNSNRQTAALRVCAFAVLVFLALGVTTKAQEREDEIIANLAGGHVIVHVAKDIIIFAAIDQPMEARSIPPRVADLDARHVGILLGASEWQVPADPKPVRLDRNVQHAVVNDPRNAGYAEQGEPDLETVGIGFLEKLRPLVGQLHHKLDFSPEVPIFELVILGYAPNYGPEVWQVDYRIEQEQVASRGEYWQTRILRPRFTQLYPPEGKHSPRTLVEINFPADAKQPSLTDWIRNHDPRIMDLRSHEPQFGKVVENLEKGQAQKAVAADATEFLRAALPLMAGKASFIEGTLEEERGFTWIVPPDEPVEKVKTDDKNKNKQEQSDEAPSLLRKPKP